MSFLFADFPPAGKALLGIALAMTVGAGCRWLNLPVPAPPRLGGALLVLAMTLGYLVGTQLGAGQ